MTVITEIAPPPEAVASNGKAPTRRRYPARVVKFARQLAERGYRPCEIREALSRYGHLPSYHVIALWIDDGYAEAEKLRRRRKPRKRRHGWEVMRARMRELRGAGVSYSNIAKVIRLDFGLDLSEDVVRAVVKGTISEPAARAHLTGERVGRGSQRYRR